MTASSAFFRDSLLWPMVWQSVYIPLLPDTMVDFLQSPVPYLLGVHVDAYERQHIHPTSGNQNADVRAAAAAAIRAAAATEDRKGQRNQTESEYDCGSEVVVANMYFEILGEQPPAVVPTEPGTREHHRFTSL